MIHNISIATDDDIIQFGDYVNIYPVYLSGTISFMEIVLIGYKRPLFKTIFFVNFL